MGQVGRGGVLGFRLDRVYKQVNLSRGVRRAAQFVSLDLGMQAIGFIVGVALIRGFPKEVYGQYAVYVGVLFASILISESGLSNVMLSHAKRHTDHQIWINDLRTSGLLVRRQLGTASSLVGAALLWYLLQENELSWTATAMAVISYLVSLQAIFVRSNAQVFLRLSGSTGASQRNLLAAAIMRLVVVIAVFVAAPAPSHFTLVVLATTGIYWTESWLMTRSLKGIGVGTGSNNAFQIRRLRRAARRLAPLNFATVGREQAFLVVMSLLGSTVVLGEVAAMTRFAIVFTLLNSFMLNMLLPRLARLHVQAAKKAIAIYSSVYLLIACLVVLSIYAASPLLLWVLGDSYRGLETELVIVMTGSSLLSFCGALGMMGQSRGWLAGAWVSLAGSAVWAAAGPVIFDLHEPMGGALYVGTQGIPVLISEIVRFVQGTRRIRTGPPNEEN